MSCRVIGSCQELPGLATSHSSESASQTVSPTAASNPNSSITIQNIGSLVPIKLTTTNYLTWSALFAPIFRRYNLTGLIDGSMVAPPQFLTDSSGNRSLNPAYVAWFENDQNILIWINSTLSESLIPYTVGVSSARELWAKLESRLAAASHSHIHELRSRLRSLTKGDLTAAQYLQRTEEIADALASAGAPVEDSELIFVILHGLPPEFDSFVDAIQFRLGSTTIDELHGLLLSKEIQLNNRKQSAPVSSFQAYNTSLVFYLCLTIPFLKAMLLSTHRPPTLKVAEWIAISLEIITIIVAISGNPIISGSLIIIEGPISGQIVDFDLTFIPPGNSLVKSVVNLTMKLATVLIAWILTIMASPTQSALAASTSNPSPTWIVDSGATSHMTNTYATLQNPETYTGPEQVYIGDGKGLPITHSGSSILHASPRNFALNNVLYVPDLKHNLLSANQFLIDNHVSMHLYPSYFLVNDLSSGKMLFKGPVQHGFYPFHQHSPAPDKHIALTAATKASRTLWHERLGHPSTRILNKLASTSCISMLQNKSTSLCSPCALGKCSRLPFVSTASTTKKPLELIHTDV